MSEERILCDDCGCQLDKDEAKFCPNCCGEYCEECVEGSKGHCPECGHSEVY